MGFDAADGFIIYATIAAASCCDWLLALLLELEEAFVVDDWVFDADVVV